MRRALLSIGLILTLSSTLACDGETQCTTSTDCPAGNRCVDGVCEDSGDTSTSRACGGDTECDDGNSCNGVERCGDVACENGAPLPDGVECDSDGSDATREVCVSDICGPTRCGDGVPDLAGGEECDDGNDVDGDGCDGCAFTCTVDAACADENECNGDETCDRPTHTCIPGTQAPDDTDCAAGVGRCVAGSCVPRMCTAAEDCSDGDVCSGDEACDAMMCTAGAPLDCDDGDACTADTCDPAEGCAHRTLDFDGDGHSADSLGPCGDDCDDTDPTIYAGAVDACDLVDNDCDGAMDEDGIVDWYPDCDGDEFAASGATPMSSCIEPAPSASGCAMGGGFTTRAPSDAANTDCNDDNPSVNPAQTMYQTTAIVGADPTVDFDYDCSGTEDPQLSTIGMCIPSGSFIRCRLVNAGGWSGAVPECGVAGATVSSCGGGSACIPITAARTQACR